MHARVAIAKQSELATRVAEGARNQSQCGGAALEEMPIAFFRHPSSARKMALPGAPGAIRFTRWIDMQHDPSNFPPVRALGVGIKQAQIGDDMLLVIAGQDPVRRRARRRRVGLAAEIASSASPSRSFGIAFP